MIKAFTAKDREAPKEVCLHFLPKLRTAELKGKGRRAPTDTGTLESILPDDVRWLRIQHLF